MASQFVVVPTFLENEKVGTRLFPLFRNQQNLEQHWVSSSRAHRAKGKLTARERIAALIALGNEPH
jgi:acetyl-CoA carboxylase carboxyltransferase component